MSMPLTTIFVIFHIDNNMIYPCLKLFIIYIEHLFV